LAARVSQAISEMVVCNGCGAPLTLRHELATRRGLVSLRICYTNTACSREEKKDPCTPAGKILNARSVLGMLEEGERLFRPQRD